MKEYTILLRGKSDHITIKAESFQVGSNVYYFLRKKTVDELTYPTALEDLSVATFTVKNSAIIKIKNIEE
jgi:hypothetical protein